jgi:tetratricopeptide (TPR) repeat protein
VTGAERRRALGRAGALADAGRLGNAMGMYGDLLREAPDDVQAMCGMSRCLGKLGRPADGLRLAERAAALAPADDWPQRLRSAHLLLLGRPREAMQAAWRARALDPSGFAAQLSVFEAQVALRQRRQAAETARSMVEDHPGEPESQNAVGRAAMLRRQWAAAEAAFREALRLAPQEPVYQSNLALALERRGRRREAMLHFRRAVQTDPGNAAVRRQLVRAIDRRLAVAGVVAGLVGGAGADVAIHVGERAVWVLAAAIAALVAGVVLLLRWWRLRELDETLRTFYRHERRRWRPLRREVQACVVSIAVTCLALVAAVAEVSGSWLAAAAATVFLAVALRWAGLPVWRRRVLPRLQARHGALRVR